MEKIEFDLLDFAKSPALEKLERCTKADLLLIAGFFDVSVPLNARKAEIKYLLATQLAQKGVLTRARSESGRVDEESDVEEGAESATATPGPSGLVEVGAEAATTTQTLTGDPVGLVQSGVDPESLKLALRLKEVELETKRSEIQFMHLRLRMLEIENGKPSVPNTPTNVNQFDVSRHIALVPPFRESEVDSYFNAFERIAATLKWPRDVWSLLLQCKLIGEAQEVCSTLSIEESLKYDVVKATILRAYELVPEAYRQKFRSCEKSADQTYVEFAREKSILFDKWCSASKATNFEQLRELILLEEFKTSLPEKIVVYLNEQKSVSLSQAAVSADEFVLTHKAIFPFTPRENKRESKQFAISNKLTSKTSDRSDLSPSERRACFYCHETGHLIAACPALQKKEKSKNSKISKSVVFVQTVPVSPVGGALESKKPAPDESYRPFILRGSVSLTGRDEDQVPVSILRDTGACQLLILSAVLPFSENSSCGSDVLVWGVKMSVLRAPLHTVYLRSPLVSGPVKLGVCSCLPVEGIALILGNDLAGDKVFPMPEVVETPVFDTDFASLPAAVSSSSVFPACAVTRAQSRKFSDVLDLSDSFLCSANVPEKENDVKKTENPVIVNLLPTDVNLSLHVDKTEFIDVQQSDPTLTTCMSMATESLGSDNLCAYSFENGVLIRTWRPPTSADLGWNSFQQVVVPQKFRNQVLSVAHDSSAGHLGIKKTYHRIMRYFFGPV